MCARAASILWEGRPVELATPHEAIEHGINAVHQEVVLCPHLTVAANLFLGDETTRFGLLQHREMVREAQTILDDLGFAPAGRRAALHPDHRPAAVGRHRPRRDAAARDS